jgi:hypothetical protein
MFRLSAAVAATLIVAMPLQAAKADAISVPKDEFGSVDAAQMESLTEQLREIGVLEKDDKLESTGDAGAKPEFAIDPVTLATLFGPLVCKYVVGEQRAKKLAKCDAKKTDAAKASCRANTDSWADPITKLCELVKLN